MPNFPVDVNSWGKSACYPRSTFCPLSDGPSTQHHQIIKTYFRTCSDCHPRSQASLCLYTRAPISNRSEETFAHLRYSLGGDRPSQTARLPVSPGRITAAGLDSQFRQGGISTSPPPVPGHWDHRLPPILRNRNRKSMTSYSKAPRGLFV